LSLDFWCEFVRRRLSQSGLATVADAISGIGGRVVVPHLRKPTQPPRFLARQIVAQRCLHKSCFARMEPAEKFIRRILKLVLMILAFSVAIVFGEFYLVWAGLER
jgi:hypothetical protein